MLIVLNHFYNKRKILLLVLFFSCYYPTIGQDAHFTQSLSTPLYQNPALAGAVPYWRMNVLYRRQWNGLPNGIESTQISADRFLIKSNSGIGALLHTDRVPFLGLTQTQLGFSFSQGVYLGRGVTFRLGAAAAIANRSVDFTSLLFADELKSGNQTAEPLNRESFWQADFSGGALVYSTLAWGGVAVFHANQPKINYQPGQANLPMRIVVQAGAQLDVARGALLPALTAQWQDGNNQLAVGANYLYKKFLAGVWLRTPPIQPEGQWQALETVSAIIGAEFTDNWRFTYSYDVQVNALGRQTGGSHEIGLQFMPKASINFLRRGASKSGQRGTYCPGYFIF